MTRFDFESTTGLVPVFPLPEMTLLPGELMPLYIFEPRYRRMVEDAIEGEKLIAMARFVPGWEDGYYGNPDVVPEMGLGNIVAHRPRPDGTAEIVLRGVARVRLLETVRDMPYRLGRVDLLPEEVSDPERMKRVAGQIWAALGSLCAHHENPCADIETRGLPLEELPGRLVPFLQFDHEVKQRLLASHDLVARLDLLLKQMRSRDRQARMAELVARLSPRDVSVN